MKILSRRHGTTLADSLCGLFIITLGLSIYVETNQMIHHQLQRSNQQLIQERHTYERKMSHEK